MTPSYLGRLFLLSGASFFLVQALASAVVALLSQTAIRRTQAMPPQRAAGFLLFLRLLPATLSLLMVFALCVPSYLRFEPRIAGEETGLFCMGVALLGAALGLASLWRASAALLQSKRYARQCGGRESSIDGEPVWIVAESAGIAMAGILHPRLLISERAASELSAEQLSVAVRHEIAHRGSRDNLKRLLILMAPPLFSELRKLEHAWIRAAEWAADDRAANGDTDRSLALAEALVRVARLQSGVRMPQLVTSLVEADEDLSLRVERLLESREADDAAFEMSRIAIATAVVILGAALNPSVMRLVHRALEGLLD